MFRTTRSVLLAVATTVAGIVALPAANAAAEPVFPTAIVSLTSGGSAIDEAVCRKGEDFSLWGDSSVNPSGGGLSYFWYSDDDSIGSEEAEYVIPCDFAGSIEVVLRATAIGKPDEYWEHDTRSVTVTSNEAPSAAISLNGKGVAGFLEVPINSSVTFSAAASVDPEGGPLTHVWTRGSERVVGETLTATCGDYPSRFNVNLEVTDNVGFVGNSQVIVDCVAAPPTGSFTPAPLPGGKRTFVPIGTKVTFTPTSPSTASDWEWRTTGVSGVATKNYSFTRTFDTLGNYGVQLTETNLNGTASQWAGYTVIAPPTVSVTPAPPRAKDRMTVVAGSTITFDGSGSASPGGGSLQYRWTTTGKPGVVADGRSYSRRFDTVGLFGVELTVVNELGQTAKRWVGLNVVAAKDPVASVTPGLPDPGKRTPTTVGSTVTFDGRASVDPDGGPLRYEWRTTGKPGVVATTATYTRKFDQVGNVGVELTVIDDEGQVAKRWVGYTVS